MPSESPIAHRVVVIGVGLDVANGNVAGSSSVESTNRRQTTPSNDQMLLAVAAADGAAGSPMPQVEGLSHMLSGSPSWQDARE